MGRRGWRTRRPPDGLIHLVTTMNKPALHFTFNEAWLFSENADVKADAALRANPRVTVRVEGHADTIPPSGGQSAAASRRYNERLSLARADSVIR